MMTGRSGAGHGPGGGGAVPCALTIAARARLTTGCALEELGSEWVAFGTGATTG